MTAAHPVDDWRPRWPTIRDLLLDESLGESEAPYLTEIDHETEHHRRWTRADWRDRVAGTAAALADRGLCPGDAVAVLAGNSADALAVAYACWVSGWTYLPINAHEPAGRQQFILRDADARLLVHTPPMAEAAAELAETVDVRAVASPEVVGAGGDLPAAGTDPAAPALRVYTSGTTGQPKGVVLTVGNLVADCDALQRVTGWDASTRALVVLPIHHVNGLIVSCLQSWYAGGSAVLCDRFRSDWFWKDVEAEGATVCSMVPTLLEFLLTDGHGPAPEGFGEVLCGAGPLMTETVLGFEEGFGVPVRHLYGLSETTAVSTLMPPLGDERRRSWYRDHGFPSIGPALPHVEVQVHRPDGGPCAEGKRGELVIRGATVMQEYAGRPDATADALRDGWFHSGDEGFWLPDAEGTRYFFVTGRIKELIIRGGVNISPLTIDEVLNIHPAVRFGLAVPFENRFYGDEIAAYVVRSAPVTEQEILDFCTERLDYAYCPKVVLFGEDIPFTVTGKAKRLALKRQLADRLAGYRDIQFRRNPTQEEGR